MIIFMQFHYLFSKVNKRTKAIQIGTNFDVEFVVVSFGFISDYIFK